MSPSRHVLEGISLGCQIEEVSLHTVTGSSSTVCRTGTTRMTTGWESRRQQPVARVLRRPGHRILVQGSWQKLSKLRQEDELRRVERVELDMASSRTLSCTHQHPDSDRSCHAMAIHIVHRSVFPGRCDGESEGWNCEPCRHCHTVRREHNLAPQHRTGRLFDVPAGRRRHGKLVHVL